MTKSTTYRDRTLRQVEMRRSDATRKIFEPYTRLRKAAHEARYDGTLFRPADVPEYVRCYDAVRQEMLKALGAVAST